MIQWGVCSEAGIEDCKSCLGGGGLDGVNDVTVFDLNFSDKNKFKKILDRIVVERRDPLGITHPGTQ